MHKLFNRDVLALVSRSSPPNVFAVNSAADTRTQLQQPVLINTWQRNSHSESNVAYTVKCRSASAGAEA